MSVMEDVEVRRYGGDPSIMADQEAKGKHAGPRSS